MTFSLKITLLHSDFVRFMSLMVPNHKTHRSDLFCNLEPFASLQNSKNIPVVDHEVMQFNFYFCKCRCLSEAFYEKLKLAI